MVSFFKKIIVENHYKTMNFFLFVLHKILFKRLNVSEFQKINKILIFRTGSIGDNICAMPVLSNIKKNFPNAKIDLLTNSGERNFVSIDKLIQSSFFNSIINYESISKKELFFLLKSNQYQLFIELTQVDSYPTRLIRNMFIIRFLDIKYAFRWHYAISYIFPKFQEKTHIFDNETQRLNQNIQKEGLTIFPTFYPFAFSDAITQKIKLFFLQNKIPNNLIGIAIGGKLERNKWSIENYRVFVQNFINQDYSIAIFGGREDFEMANKLTENKKIFNFCGLFSPLESLQAMKKCRLIISNDTGTLHMAYSVNIPLIALYSSREYPGKWFPPKDSVHFVFRTSDVKCSICWQKGKNKPCHSNVCMQAIQPKTVIQKAQEMLNSL